MLGWFDYHLKGTGIGQPKKELQFDLRVLNQIHDPPKGDWNGRSSGSREVQGTAQAESA